MKGLHRMLLSVYVGVIVYMILAFLFGASGILSMVGLERHEKELEAAITDLETENDELKKQIGSLLGDPERIRLEARSLGFYRDTEGIIRFRGAGSVAKSYDLGRVIEDRREAEDRRGLFRAVASAAVLASYVLLTLFRGRSDAILRHSK